jgi:hypothetical protein
LVNQAIEVTSVMNILSHEFIDCGYRLMTSYLQQDGYLINHKKLYRIMKEEGLIKLENTNTLKDSTMLKRLNEIASFSKQEQEHILFALDAMISKIKLGNI